MIIIPIKSKTYGEHNVFIDGEDFDKIKEYTWCLSKIGNCFYACSGLYDKKTKKKTTIHMHRIIMDTSKDYIIDHVNGNALDNRKENLRICSNAENLRNRKKQKNTSSIYKGVCFDKRDKKWRASIRLNNKLMYIGLFDTQTQAAKAYNKAAVENFGEFARLNIIE